ncbi:hypothetical protein DRQ12_04170 [candidate division KSB1 bacterium]|nr:MAG: hypothetical protein B5M50_02970 [candidate division KSB1 bacterium 4484_219]RKY79261.1 MAG: hypothetical protein DRQ12_04170 [candidate division KSB1 bacterium]
MNKIIRLPVILCTTTIIAAGALAIVNNLTKPRIDAQKKAALQAALTQVLPRAKEGVIVPVKRSGKLEYYVGYARKDTTNKVGYIFIARGKGYSSTIETLVGINTAGIIEGIKVLHQLETPGLGAKIVEIRHGEQKPWFQVQFIGKRKDDLTVDKDGGTIQSITGATISSRALTNSIRQAIEELEKKIGGFAKVDNRVKPDGKNGIPCITGATVPSLSPVRSTGKASSDR